MIIKLINASNEKMNGWTYINEMKWMKERMDAYKWNECMTVTGQMIVCKCHEWKRINECISWWNKGMNENKLMYANEIKGW